MRRAPWIFTLPLLGLSCTTPQSAYRPDFSLLRPYTFDMDKARAHASPYVATFTNGSKRIFYVAARHAVYDQAVDIKQHPTFLTIKKLFREHPIDAVVVEGLSQWSGDLPPSVLTHADECEASGYKTNCGEAWYAAFLGKKSGARVLSGEPAEADVLKVITERGHTIEDLLAFYVVRQIPQMKSEPGYHRSHAREQLERTIAQKKRILETDVAFTFEDFTKWYGENMTSPADFLDITVNDTAPISSPDATAVQKLSSLVNVARDRAIVSWIANAATRQSNILVVYGSSHFDISRLALEKMFGQPQYEKFY